MFCTKYILCVLANFEVEGAVCNRAAQTQLKKKEDLFVWIAGKSNRTLTDKLVSVNRQANDRGNSAAACTTVWLSNNGIHHTHKKKNKNKKKQLPQNHDKKVLKGWYSSMRISLTQKEVHWPGKMKVRVCKNWLSGILLC